MREREGVLRLDLRVILLEEWIGGSGEGVRESNWDGCCI